MRNNDARSEPTLRLLSWGGAWGRAMLEAVVAPFTRKTGIRVDPQFHVGLVLPDPLDCDVVWSNAVPAMRVAQDGGCLALRESELPNLASLDSRAKPLAFSEGWPLVCPYATQYVLGYRRQAFPEGKPDSWSVLLEPRFRGKVALYPEGNGIHAIAQVMGGGKLEDIPEAMGACWEFLSALRPQIGRLDYSIGMEERIRRQELDLFFRALPNALAFGQAGLDVDWVAPREGISDTLDALWIPSGVPEKRLSSAKSFIDFALSPSVLRDWCQQLGVLPLNLEAAPPSLFDENRGLAKILHIPEMVKLRHRQAWKNKFEEIFRF